ncbi:unnamed protein product [Ixodes persulcatus]
MNCARPITTMANLYWKRKLKTRPFFFFLCESIN